MSGDEFEELRTDILRRIDQLQALQQDAVRQQDVRLEILKQEELQQEAHVDAASQPAIAAGTSADAQIDVVQEGINVAQGEKDDHLRFRCSWQV